jgi:HTH-type transcriptional regulator/antitoxin HigA
VETAPSETRAMTNSSEVTNRDWFSKPGDSIASLLKRKKISAAYLAEQLGGPQTLRELLSGELAIDKRIARVLAEVCGGSAEFWLRRQENFERDLNRAADSIASTEADDWLKVAKVPGVTPKGRLSQRNRLNEIKRRLVFYDISQPHQWRSRYGELLEKVKLRTSQRFESAPSAMAMWLRQGEIEAQLIETADWNPSALRRRLGEIKKLSLRKQPSAFLSDLRRICAEVGIALVVARAPDGCRASGASKLLSDHKAMILMSFRFRSNDHFWFTLFHELGHLLLHEREVWVDFDLDELDTKEQEANSFARDLIIPPPRRSEFARLPKKRDDIMRFAISLDVAPGLIVGQMQHRGMLDQGAFSYLKRRWSWEEIESAAEAA